MMFGMNVDCVPISIAFGAIFGDVSEDTALHTVLPIEAGRCDKRRASKMLGLMLGWSRNSNRCPLIYGLPLPRCRLKRDPGATTQGGVRKGGMNGIHAGLGWETIR
jgi:hypothetical protein